MTLVLILTNGKVVLLLSGLISLFIVWRTFIPRDRKLRISDILYLGHVSALSLLLFVLYTFCYYSVTHHQRTTAFNKLLWNANPEKRIEMVDDLINRDILHAKDTNAVIGLLGRPTRVIKDSLISNFQYYVGFKDASFDIDPSFLIVEVQAGHVNKYYTIPGIPDLP